MNIVVLESSWSPETRRFYLWAENEELYEQCRNAEHGTPQQFAEHPFVYSPESLERDLAEFEFQDIERTVINLLLPTRSQLPCCSPRFRLNSGEVEEPSGLHVWQVPALSLSAVEALNFLTSPGVPIPENFRLDDSVLFFREATKLVLDLMTRGRFLPFIKRSEKNFQSLWIPITAGEQDHERLTLLGQAIPPICAAFPGRLEEPSAVLENFIEVCCDSLIRLFLRSNKLLPPGAGTRTGLGADWLNSLTAPSPDMAVGDADAARVEERLKTWSARMLPAERGELRTVLHLIAPGDESESDDDWRIEFFLRSATNTEIILPAGKLWSGDLEVLKNLDASPEDIEDALLRGLGMAIGIYPEFKRSLVDSYPTGLDLNGVEAYDFLRNKSTLLEELGFEVIYPDWWDKPESKLGLQLSLNSSEMRPSAQSRVPFLAAQSLLDFSWSVVFGSRELSRDDFTKLTDEKSPLVRIDGKWVELEPVKVESTLKFLEDQQQRGKLTFIEALHLGLGLEDRSSTFPVVGFNAKGWIEQLLNSESHSIELITEPEGFLGELRPYQREGLSWLAFRSQLGLGACLADDMGLGKTVQFLALMLFEKKRNIESGTALRPNLLIVPMSILTNWEHEIKRFAPSLSVYLHHGAQRLTGDLFIQRAQASDLVITTYSLAFRDEEFISQVTWAGIVLDEAQNIKNTETKQTRAIRRLCQVQMQRAGGHIPFNRIALTGTPLENHLEELWSIFDFLNPGFLGTLGEFRSRFAVQIERFRNKDVANTLSRLLRPFVLRRLKSDPKIINDLPEKIEIAEVVPLTREQAQLYQAALEEMMPQVEAAHGMHRKGLVLATITKLKQICNHPALFLKDGTDLKGRSHKISRLEELLEEILAEGDKVLMFTQFSQLGHLLQPYLQQRFDTEVLFLHGALPKQAREKLVTKFQQPTGPAFFILSLKAGGFGLNLTEANQVIHLDQWWNPAVEDQATDRAYRIGQKRNVQVRKLICQGTLEERIAEMLKHKKELADQIVGATKDSITQLSTDELRRLLELSSYPEGVDSAVYEEED